MFDVSSPIPGVSIRQAGARIRTAISARKRLTRTSSRYEQRPYRSRALPASAFPTCADPCTPGYRMVAGMKNIAWFVLPILAACGSNPTSPRAPQGIVAVDEGVGQGGATLGGVLAEFAPVSVWGPS